MRLVYWSPFADTPECATPVSTLRRHWPPTRVSSLNFPQRMRCHQDLSADFGKSSLYCSCTALWTLAFLPASAGHPVVLLLQCCPLKISDIPRSDNPTIVLRECDTGHKSALTSIASCVFSTPVTRVLAMHLGPTTAIAAVLQRLPSKHYTKEAVLFRLLTWRAERLRSR